MKHTKGPWKLKAVYGGQEVRVKDGTWPQGTRPLAVTKNTGWEEENTANAHLIAAAPELLEACKEALDQLESFNPELEPTFTMKRLGELITKAQGN